MILRRVTNTNYKGSLVTEILKNSSTLLEKQIIIELLTEELHRIHCLYSKIRNYTKRQGTINNIVRFTDVKCSGCIYMYASM